MGLDMYLTAECWIPLDATLICKNADGEEIEYEDVQSVVLNVGYWRKANAIHKWFVDNIQEEEDNCAKYWVSEDLLGELIKVCEEVLEHRHGDDFEEVANELLPPTEGFFFGSTKIDEYYIDDLEETIRFCRKALTFIKEFNADIYYQSSW